MSDEGRLESWKGRWDGDDIPWHQTQANTSLVDHWMKVSQGRQDLRVLFPLCGASVDLAWLYKQGHTVVGVEGARKAVEKLFAEAEVEFDVSNLDEDDGIKFETKDSRLTVFIRDFLGTSKDIAGTFDAVFDRGALEALNESDRPAYIATIRNLLKDDFSYILTGFDYRPEQKTGPPRPLPLAVVEQLFGDFARVELLTQEEEPDRAIKWNIPNLIRNTYLIRRK